MLKSVGYSLSDTTFDENVEAVSEDKLTPLFDYLVQKIEKDPTFNKQVNTFIETLKQSSKGIDDKTFMLRFQTYAYRNSSPSVVFSNLYAAFKATKRSSLLVGVNILGAENNPIALKYYTLHMQMFAYLSKQFPTVKKALHAGELTLGMVRPKNLIYHITQAIDIANAQRIGHGIDLPYETHAIELLQKIKKSAVIEVCLTSNEFILGVKKNAHPYLIYSAYDVPIVICTDDSGVSRNNLSNEYLKLATRYKPNYKTIKKYVYNSIKYSFLNKQEKERLIGKLDTQFKHFESKISRYANLISNKQQ
jgi:adenosine deaminase/adenosine deaminase CECR1